MKHFTGISTKFALVLLLMLCSFVALAQHAVSARVTGVDGAKK